MTELRFHKEIYAGWALQSAVAAYGALATITIRDDDEYHICQFDRCRYEEKLTVKEFQNYLIDLMNSHSGEESCYANC